MGAPWLTAALEAAASTWGALDTLVDVTLEQWIGDSDDEPEADFDSPITLRARVQEGTIAVRNTLGETIFARAFLAIHSTIPHNEAVGRQAEPIDPRDRFTLPSGFVGTIVDNVNATHYVEATGGQAEGLPVYAVWLR